MGGEGFHGARPKQGGLIVAAGVAVVLLVALLLYRYDLVHFDANTLADRVRASGTVGLLALIALLIVQAVIAPLPSPPILLAARVGHRRGRGPKGRKLHVHRVRSRWRFELAHCMGVARSSHRRGCTPNGAVAPGRQGRQNASADSRSVEPLERAAQHGNEPGRFEL